MNATVRAAVCVHSTRPAEPRPAAQISRVRSLDGLRFFAFLGVFLFHADESLFRFGRYGVQVFLVLSGFLIGNILLNLRTRSELSISSRLRLFYLRRSLRIFPVYYFLLLLILLFSILHLVTPRLGAWPFHALYLTNFYLVVTGAEIDSQTHLWSLSVEEQFYLLAPLALLRLRPRYVALGCAGFLLIDASLRAINFLSWHISRLEYVSLLQFDTLGCGILAALLLQRFPPDGLAVRRLRRTALVCGVACLGIVVGSYWPGELRRMADQVVLPTVLAVCAAGLILELWNGNIRWLSALLSWRPFAYLGKISYGLYLYHNFLFVIARGTHGAWRAIALAAAFAVTVAVAALSWHILEEPLLRIRKHLEADTRKSSYSADLDKSVTPASA